MREQEIFLHLDSSYKIKYEGIDQFDDSLFSEVYMQAVRTVNEIQKKNEEYHQDKKSGNAHRNKEQIYNIISFIGGRGTGKTSAMLSFAEYLKDYYRIRDGVNNNFHMKESFFVGVDFIDAGLLEKEEDLIEIVLARMLHKLSEIEKINSYREPGYDYKRKEFYQELRQIYNNLKSLNQKQTNTYWRQESSLDDLLQLSVSYNLRESMKNLVAKYLELGYYDYVRDNVKLENRYLVIPIDDVDMLVEKGYMMVEQIRRYLMIPNVIVLLSFDYKQLMYICKCHYIKGFSKEIKNLGSKELEAEKKEILKWAEQLSKQYLDKMIPDGRKIYLPSLKGESYFTKRKIKIMPDKMSKDMSENKSKSCGIQEFIFYHLAQSLDIYFYGNQGGRHFLEPESLRKLSNYCYVLRSLEKDICFYPGAGNKQGIEAGTEERRKNSADGQAEKYLTNFGRNYTWLIKDLYFKIYKLNKVPVIVKDTLDAIQGEDLEMQIHEIMEALWSGCTREAMRENGRAFMLFNGSDARIPDHEDSLGDFMHFLYEHQDSVPRSLALLLLAYVSAIVSGKLYLNRLKAYDNQGDYRAETIESLGLSNSFGSWDGMILNWSSDDTEPFILGKEEQFQIGRNWKLELEVSKEQGKWMIANHPKNKRALNTFELNWLFFDRYSDKESKEIGDLPGLDFTCTKRRDEKPSKQYYEFVPSDGYMARYQISNFIKNIYRYEEIFETLHQHILEAIRKLKKQPVQDMEIALGDRLKELSIINDFKKWEITYGTRMVIPVQNLEFMYKVLQNMVLKKPDSIRNDTREDLLKGYFNTISEELSKQLDFYKTIPQVDCESGNEWQPVDFKKIYRECPLIKEILGLEKENSPEKNSSEKDSPEKNSSEENSSEKDSSQKNGSLYLGELVKVLESGEAAAEQARADTEDIVDNE